MNIELHQNTTGDISLLYQSIKNDELENLKSLLNNGADVNAPIWTTGPFAGYTALHVACMENKDDLVDLLIFDYQADVNIVAEDGTQPIHLACLYEPRLWQYDALDRKLSSLLAANADADAEIRRETFRNHVKDEEWCADFDDKMPLIAYAIIYKKEDLATCFVERNANPKVFNLNNKTLLMYAIENNMYNTVEILLKYIKDPAYINHRDNEGFPATHYTLHPKDERKGYWHDVAPTRTEMMYLLFLAGADIYALLNDDSETLLPNIAAKRLYSSFLKCMLPLYSSIPLSKVLYYATRPTDEILPKFVQTYSIDNPDSYNFYKNLLRERKQECIEVTLGDLINRRTFGLYVYKEDVQLMDNLILSNSDIKNVVDNYKKNFLNGELKSKFIEVNNKKITCYEFFMQVFNDKKLKLLVRDENITCSTRTTPWLSIADFRNFYYEYEYFEIPVERRIINCRERLELLKKLTKISILREAIDLPYELVLDIIEYLSNADLSSFINAFICQ